VTFPPLRLTYNPRAAESRDKSLSLVPYITQREGEDAAPDNLVIMRHSSSPRLYYADEDPRTETRGACSGPGAGGTLSTPKAESPVCRSGS
jgi:hypothetical protein